MRKFIVYLQLPAFLPPSPKKHIKQNKNCRWKYIFNKISFSLGLVYVFSFLTFFLQISPVNGKRKNTYKSITNRFSPTNIYVYEYHTHHHRHYTRMQPPKIFKSFSCTECGQPTCHPPLCVPLNSAGSKIVLFIFVYSFRLMLFFRLRCL